MPCLLSMLYLLNRMTFSDYVGLQRFQPPFSRFNAEHGINHYSPPEA